MNIGMLRTWKIFHFKFNKGNIILYLFKDNTHIIFNEIKKTGTFLRVPAIKPGPEPTNARET